MDFRFRPQFSYFTDSPQITLQLLLRSMYLLLLETCLFKSALLVLLVLLVLVLVLLVLQLGRPGCGARRAEGGGVAGGEAWKKGGREETP